MNFECWTTNAWAVGSWVDGSWCPGTPPVPPTPAPVVRIEPRRWPGPPIVIYEEGVHWLHLRREDEEITIL